MLHFLKIRAVIIIALRKPIMGIENQIQKVLELENLDKIMEERTVKFVCSIHCIFIISIY